PLCLGNCRAGSQSDARHSMLPRKNGAPGNVTGACGLIDSANKPFASGGPTIAVAVITLVIAPWSSPCSLAATARDIRPWTAGLSRPKPRQYSTVTAYIIQPWLDSPNSRLPSTAITSAFNSVRNSPYGTTIGRPYSTFE